MVIHNNITVANKILNNKKDYYVYGDNTLIWNYLEKHRRPNNKAVTSIYYYSKINIK